MNFQTLGDVSALVFSELTEKRFAERDLGLLIRVEEGQKRRIDASLLTENYERYWSVREEAAERERQAHLLRRARRQGARGGPGRLR